ncbi:hypothetical protein [Streptomyces sp. NPDC002889]|uniref:hypothetical protein n=1 Tax=Streptomyces sp. NPDC002889 TaxID=3364669 RepID=UPI003681E8FB
MEVVSLGVSFASTVVAIIGAVYSAKAIRISSKLSQESNRLAGEQEQIKRTIKSNVVGRLLAIYQTILDFDDYIWLAYRDEYPFDADVVAEFYLDRFTELTGVRTSGAYTEYLRVLEDFPGDVVVDRDDILVSVREIGESDESRIRQFEGEQVRTIFLEFEKSFWRNLFHVSQKIRNRPTLREPGERPGWLDRLDGEVASGVEAVMLYSFHNMRDLEIFVPLLRRYGDHVTDVIEQRLGTSVAETR